MFRAIGRLPVVLGFVWAGAANAGMMPPVTVDGQEWLQPADFVNLSWQDISATCDPTSGACSGNLGSIDVSGYTWAGVDDLNGLFNYYLNSVHTLGPGPDVFVQLDSAGAHAFFADGWSPSRIDFVDRVTLLGLTRTLFDPFSAYYAYVSEDAHVPFESWRRSFWVTENLITIERTDDRLGVWLFRDAPEPIPEIPNPATLPLLGLGLAALGFSRRKQKQHV